MDTVVDDNDAMCQIEVLLESCHFKEALVLCQRIQQSAQLPRKFWFCLAGALEGTGNKVRAIQAYRTEIASLSKCPPDLLGHIGVLLMEVGQYGESVICLNKSCELEPSVERLVLLSSALAHLGKFVDARQTLKRAIELNPTFDEAWHNLGGILLRDSPKEAENAFRNAISISPRKAASHGGLAMSLFAQRLFHEAIHAARVGLQSDSLDGLCHQAMANGMEGSGDLEGSLSAYSRAFRCDYDKVEAILGVARVLESLGRFQEASDWYARTLRAWPDDLRIAAGFRAFSDRYSAIGQKGDS